ncbi:hypothetical protein BKA16_003513 [Gordonia humi]|uniref:Uncharacterized protein n=1 Tax=Gordonia humi TaxID=686429 RepID=A0A840EZD8_9ACTN|nr:hypothetical protein [Gordonia humi]
MTEVLPRSGSVSSVRECLCPLSPFCHHFPDRGKQSAVSPPQLQNRTSPPNTRNALTWQESVQPSSAVIANCLHGVLAPLRLLTRAVPGRHRASGRRARADSRPPRDRPPVGPPTADAACAARRRGRSWRSAAVEPITPTRRAGRSTLITRIGRTASTAAAVIGTMRGPDSSPGTLRRRVST